MPRGASVVLVELGGTDSNPAIYDGNLMAMFGLWAPDGPENWGYQTVEQPGLAGRAIDIAPFGDRLGGLRRYHR